MLSQLLMLIKLVLMIMQQHMSERTHVPCTCKCHFYKEIVSFSHSALEEFGFGLQCGQDGCCGPPCRSKHCGPASDRNEPPAASLKLGPDCPKSGRRCIFVGQNIPRWDSIGITQLPPKAADQERRISGERSELRLVDFNKYTKLQVKQSFKQTDAFWQVFLPKIRKFFKTAFLTLGMDNLKFCA